MSEAEVDTAASGGAGQTDEHIDQERRKALTRFAKYTAPTMLAVLLSVQTGIATPVGSPV